MLPKHGEYPRFDLRGCSIVDGYIRGVSLYLQLNIPHRPATIRYGSYHRHVSYE